MTALGPDPAQQLPELKGTLIVMEESVDCYLVQRLTNLY